MTTTIENSNQLQPSELNITTRAAVLDALDGNLTVDESSRTVSATVATEARVMIWARDRQQVVEEVLEMRGYSPSAANIPLLENHARWSLDDVFGSARNLQVENGELTATLHFANLMQDLPTDANSKRVERAWLKVKQGHQKQVSLGYDVLEAQYVEPNQTKTIGGRSYTAGQLPLRVATSWRPKEVSLTPIAADQFSSTRSESEMSKNESKPDLKPAEETAENVTADVAVRSAPAPQPVEQTPVESLTMSDLRAERSRVDGINQLFAESQINDEAMRSEAINEGWSVEKVAHEVILPAIRSRPAPIEAGENVAIHSRGSEDINQDVLIAAFNKRNRIDCDHSIWNHRGLSAMDTANTVMRRSIDDDERQQVMERADRLGHVSMYDMCRFALAAAGQKISVNNDENFRSAMSSGALEPIFTTNMNTRILASFVESEDTTRGWTMEDDVSNFKQNERPTMGKGKALRKLGRGGTAEHTDIGATMEPFRIARYAEQFVVDEQDFIDDSFGALNRAMPEDMGAAAAQLRPDLVYAILLANPSLNATGLPLFDAGNGNGNLFTATPLTRENIEKLITAMMDERIRNRPINARLRYLLLPPDLFFEADRIVNSPAVAADTEKGTKNTLEGRGITIVGESRLGVGGVVDPDTETTYAGSATDYYTSARPGEDNAQTVLVAYRSGTGRSPQIRSFMLDRGQWGMGWDINMDIGAKAMNWRFMQKAVAT